MTDGIDRCLVGFLPRHCVRHKEKDEGRVAQIVEFLESIFCTTKIPPKPRSLDGSFSITTKFSMNTTSMLDIKKSMKEE